MLSQELNDRLTRVGPGTPMGALLRRYWHPVAIASEVTKERIKKVRVLGEDLVVFKDVRGNLGMIAEQCPHRKVSLEYGIPEEEGIRCPYHGWLFNGEGRCLEQPAEPPESTFKDRITTPAYKVQELGGLIFAYMGPEPAPELPRFDLFADEGVKMIGHALIPCNWLQVMENSVDPTHTEWLHGYYFNKLEGSPESEMLSKHHIKIGFDVFEYGIIKRRVLEGHTEEEEDWTIGHPLIFPNYLKVGIQGRSSFQIRVPVDDTHTWHVWYSVYQPEGVDFTEHKEISVYEVPIKDEKGKFITDFVDGQDIMAWATQGPITDRTDERLGASDKGVILFRHLLQEQLAKVENGEDPMGVIRDAATSEYVHFPVEKHKGQFAIGKKISLSRIHAKYDPNHKKIEELVNRNLK